MNVPYFDLKGQIQSIRPELDRAIAEQLDNGSFCLGPAVEAFEKAFATYTGAKYSLGFNSGTSALHVATRILNLGEGDEVITTPYTFVATSWAIVYTNAKPVYVDVDPATMNMDPAKIEAAITPRTKAIMPVHLYGHPVDLDPILKICAKHNLALIEDAAQAHGATYQGRPVGTFGVMSGFSFYPGKNLGACGEGGALVTNDAAIYKRAKALREHGSYERYYHDEIGYNYRMEGIQGAALGVKLPHLPAWTARRRAIAHRYHQLLAGTPLTLPVEAAYAESVYHLYVVRHANRDALREFLTKRGIGCALHYPLPCHLQKCFAYLGHKAGDFPVAEQSARECLSLPIYPELSDAQQDAVAAAIREFFSSGAGKS
jgi:dTDP-4-amino-4,6-dideoxygalactose transaminase